MCRIIFALLLTLASQVLAEENCDVLGSLQADPLAVTEAVEFANIKARALIAACDKALKADAKNQSRYLLQRARGYLRLGEGAMAIADIKQSHEMGYPAATFAFATAYFLGDDVEQDYGKAEKLFLEAYGRGVFWAARGLSLIYSDDFSEYYSKKKSVAWLEKFEASTKK